MIHVKGKCQVIHNIHKKKKRFSLIFFFLQLERCLWTKEELNLFISLFTGLF